MKNNTVAKHYHLSKELSDELKSKMKGRFTTEIKAVEFYLKQGFIYDEAKDSLEEISKEINKCKNDVSFIKKLLIQLFVNKKFPLNRTIKDDEAYNNFIKNIYKDKYID